MVYFLHSDHGYPADSLGSTSLATTAAGTEVAGSRTWYKPYGEVRGGGSGSPTDFGFNGQRGEPSLGGLLDYHARYYDPLLARFISADTIVPEPSDPQLLVRYSYVRNNPLKYVDPTGHFLQCRNGKCYDDGYSISNPSFTSDDADERRAELLRYNNSLYGWARKGWITDLQAFAELCDYGASMIPADISGDRTNLWC